MKKYLGPISAAIILVIYILVTVYRNKTEFPILFEEYNYTYCLTTGKSIGNNGLSVSVGYKYKVNGEVYRGSYSINNQTNLRTEHGKYLVVYSEKEPAYHVFFEIEVEDGETGNYDISKEELRKRFDVNSKAKRIKGKYSIDNNRNKAPEVKVPEINVVGEKINND
nr:hypothetical protein [uncultured Carboxylicivirga sp.]